MCSRWLPEANPCGSAPRIVTSEATMIKGLDVDVFGEPECSFWEKTMPASMFLRSNWTATQIADPDHQLTLEDYQAEYGNHPQRGSRRGNI